jgi:hypothetical protein
VEWEAPAIFEGFKDVLQSRDTHGQIDYYIRCTAISEYADAYEKVIIMKGSADESVYLRADFEELESYVEYRFEVTVVFRDVQSAYGMDLAGLEAAMHGTRVFWGRIFVARGCTSLSLSLSLSLSHTHTHLRWRTNGKGAIQ